jgi:Cu+-exporting ATPase
MLVSFAKKSTNIHTCYHCGEPCMSDYFHQEDKFFCCQGCLSVYELLNENQLCEYYNLNDKAGINHKIITEKSKFLYADLPEIQAKLIDFQGENITKITFFIPSIHCSSCIWLLEHLYRLNENIGFSQINFLKKQLSIHFNHNKIKLSEIIGLLASIGYEPKITLNDTEATSDVRKDRNTNKENHRLIAQIAVAGFVFGNVMLLSFPEYFGFDSLSETNFKYIFNTLNLLFSIPVILFSGQDYISSAYKNLRKGILHVDFPLAVGILVLWFRSIFEILTQTGAGYIDSMSGLIFFLLVGKWFQQRTYQSLRYDRDFKSYFPVAVIVKDENGHEKPTQLADLQVNDRIIIRNEEIIPADAIFYNGTANIDYSFVTGEAVPIKKVSGEIIYAGGRQIGSQIELEIIKPVSQSYLTQLWNHENNHTQLDSKEKVNKEENSLLQAILNRYFTLALFIIALLSSSYWLFYKHELVTAINVFTSVLIIACPCALSLGSQFALGTAMRILGRHKFYLKNTRIVEQIAENDTIIFDKTGTITENNTTEINFIAYKNCKIVEKLTYNTDKDEKPIYNQITNQNISQTEIILQDCSINSLEESELVAIFSLTKNSTHPLSEAITGYLKNILETKQDLPEVESFREYVGQGLEGKVGNMYVKLGSRKFITGKDIECLLKPDCEHITDDKSTKVFVAINFVYKGYFSFENRYRENIAETIEKLHSKKFNLHLLSGDNDSEKKNLLPLFKDENHLHFQQNPHDKLNFIKNLQTQHHKVMMIGDGLNDAGALRQSETGIAITENSAYFTPASDAILEANALHKLPNFIDFCRHTVKTIKKSFAIALLYNLVGLFFAIKGDLSPIIAAILMPVSSITIILFTTLWVAKFPIESK